MKNRFKQNVGSLYIFLGITFCIIAIALLTYPQLPYIFNKLSLNTSQNEEDVITEPIYEEDLVEDETQEIKKISLPPINDSLPKERYIIIPKIGVHAQIQEGEDPHKALANGPWIVSDYASPENRYLQETTKSIIIASHRFGYSSWSEEKRDLISFLKLPETNIGDKIIIIWNQREYLYEIVEIEKGTHIEYYDTDLILYTCNYYNSPIRIFRYANLVSINNQVVE